MNDILTALIPILFLILLGYGLKQTKFLAKESWLGLERLTYFILFPALLIHKLGSQTLTGTPWPSLLIVVAVTLIIAAAVLIAWYRIYATVSGATFTSIFQGGVRFNTYITLAVAQAFFGPEGLALGAVVAGFMIVLINIFCVSAFLVWGQGAGKGVRPFVREILTNPLILGSTVGWFLSLSNIGLPGVTEDVLKIISQAALPFGLLAVGAALRPRAVFSHVRAIFVSSVVQFGLKPLVTAVLIYFTGLKGVAAGVLVIALMTPTAPSAYILARQLGGDTETMSSIITFQTLLAFIIMPIIAMIML